MKPRPQAPEQRRPWGGLWGTARPPAETREAQVLRSPCQTCPEAPSTASRPPGEPAALRKASYYEYMVYLFHWRTKKQKTEKRKYTARNPITVACFLPTSVPPCTAKELFFSYFGYDIHTISYPSSLFTIIAERIFY